MRATLRSVRQIAGFSALLLALIEAPPTAAATTLPNPELCRPPIFEGDNGLFRDRYPVADDAFDRQNYRLAFRAYYQFFFCFMGSGETTINPAAEDSGGAALLQSAISAAARGDFVSALAQAISAVKTDPRLGEAQFIIGDINWILKKPAAARASWQAAADNPGYASPPHDLTIKSPLTVAALRMLRIHHEKPKKR